MQELEAYDPAMQRVGTYVTTGNPSDEGVWAMDPAQAKVETTFQMHGCRSEAVGAHGAVDEGNSQGRNPGRESHLY